MHALTFSFLIALSYFLTATKPLIFSYLFNSLSAPTNSLIPSVLPFLSSSVHLHPYCTFTQKVGHLDARHISNTQIEMLNSVSPVSSHFNKNSYFYMYGILFFRLLCYHLKITQFKLYLRIVKYREIFRICKFLRQHFLSPIQYVQLHSNSYLFYQQS